MFGWGNGKTRVGGLRIHIGEQLRTKKNLKKRNKNGNMIPRHYKVTKFKTVWYWCRGIKNDWQIRDRPMQWWKFYLWQVGRPISLRRKIMYLFQSCPTEIWCEPHLPFKIFQYPSFKELKETSEINFNNIFCLTPNIWNIILPCNHYKIIEILYFTWY